MNKEALWVADLVAIQSTSVASLVVCAPKGVQKGLVVLCKRVAIGTIQVVLVFANVVKP